MPRHVIVLSGDAALFANVRAALSDDVRFDCTGDTVHCDGEGAPLTNIYP